MTTLATLTFENVSYPWLWLALMALLLVYLAWAYRGFYRRTGGATRPRSSNAAISEPGR